MKYNYDYNTELKNILDKIYEAKIHDIIKKNNFNNINEHSYIPINRVGLVKNNKKAAISGFSHTTRFIPIKLIYI